MPWLLWQSSIVEYNRLVNLLVIKKGVLGWDLWRMEVDGRPFRVDRKHMFLKGFPADRTKQTQKFGTRPHNDGYLSKTQISFLKNCFSSLSSLYVDVATKVRTYLWVHQAADRSLPTSTQLHPFTNNMTKQPHHRDSQQNNPETVLKTTRSSIEIRGTH